MIVNAQHKVFWAERTDNLGWQFPQGGIDKNETPTEAMFRELYEEIGLQSHHVEMIGETKDWLRYQLPGYRRRLFGDITGQKQKWFLLKMLCEDGQVKLDASGTPEFQSWRWVSYWYPVGQVIDFKRQVYRQALNDLSQHIRR